MLAILHVVTITQEKSQIYFILQFRHLWNLRIMNRLWHSGINSRIHIKIRRNRRKTILGCHPYPRTLLRKPSGNQTFPGFHLLQEFPQNHILIPFTGIEPYYSCSRRNGKITDKSPLRRLAHQKAVSTSFPIILVQIIINLSSTRKIQPCKVCPDRQLDSLIQQKLMEWLRYRQQIFDSGNSRSKIGIVNVFRRIIKHYTVQFCRIFPHQFETFCTRQLIHT